MTIANDAVSQAHAQAFVAITCTCSGNGDMTDQ